MLDVVVAGSKGGAGAGAGAGAIGTFLGLRATSARRGTFGTSGNDANDVMAVEGGEHMAYAP